MTWADSLGVELELVETAERIELHDIGRSERSPKGSGARVVAALCQYADAKRKNIVLEALDDAPKRIAYFKRLGFVTTATETPIDDAGTLMVRKHR